MGSLPRRMSEDDAFQNESSSIRALIKDPNYTFAAVTGGWAYFNYNFMGPVLSIVLMDMDLN